MFTRKLRNTGLTTDCRSPEAKGQVIEKTQKYIPTDNIKFMHNKYTLWRTHALVLVIC